MKTFKDFITEGRYEGLDIRTSGKVPHDLDDADIKQMVTGHWSLLKGGAWNDKFNGVVHRSPHDEKDRLILSIDPIFDL